MNGEPRRVRVEIGDEPWFTRVSVEGNVIPVSSVVIESKPLDKESVLILRIPMHFVELEGDR